MKTSRLAALTLLIVLVVSPFYTVSSQHAQAQASVSQDALWVVAPLVVFSKSIRQMTALMLKTTRLKDSGRDHAQR